MTYEEITRLARSLCKETYTPGQWVFWINAWLDDMAKEAKVIGQATINLSEGTHEYSLPDDCREVLIAHRLSGDTKQRLTKRQPTDVFFDGWKHLGGQIVLQGIDIHAGDKLSIIYAKRFKHITADDFEKEPEDIPPEFHSAGAYFAAHKALVRENLEGSASQRDYCLSQYLDLRDNFARSQERLARTGRIKPRPYY